MALRELTLRKFSEISNQINSTEDLHDLLTLIMDTSKELLHTEGSSLLLYDARKNELVFDIVRGPKGNLLANQRIHLGQGIAGLVAQDSEPIIVNDAINDDRIFRTFDERNKFRTRNLMAVPLLSRGLLIGVLEVVNTIDGRDFSSLDLAIFEYLATQAAIAIHNRRLFQDLRIRMDELTCIHELSQVLAGSFDFFSTIGNVIEAISQTLHAEKVSLLMENDQGEKELIASKGIEKYPKDRPASKQVIADIVMESGDGLLITDIETEIPDYSVQNTGVYKTKSFVSVPVKHKKKIYGVLSVTDKEHHGSFDTFDFRVLSTIADQIANAYANYRNQQESIYIRQVKKDLQTAAMIQRNSLPLLPDTFHGLEIAYHYAACEAVGGDFYDMIPVGEHCVHFLIGDVSGKGVSAALFMEHVKTLLQSLIPRFKNPRTTIAELNKKILSDNRHSLFATVMIIQIETEFHQLRYASAGHNHQFLIRTNGEIISLSGKGPPVGTFRIDRYTESILTYEKGDMVFLYTDGLTESLNDHEEEFGEERLIAILSDIQNAPNRGVRQILDDILGKITEFTTNMRLQDDITMLLIRL